LRDQTNGRLIQGGGGGGGEKENKIFFTIKKSKNWTLQNYYTNILGPKHVSSDGARLAPKHVG
jgi:hypothetical protein